MVCSHHEFQSVSRTAILNYFNLFFSRPFSYDPRIIESETFLYKKYGYFL